MPVIANAANSDASRSTAIAIVKTVPALLTAISLLVGIIVGIDQISRTTKARRRIEWIDKAVDGNASCEFRQQVLNELRLSQESALVASLYVPWRKFMWLPSWILGFGAIAVSFQVHNEISKDSALPWGLYFIGCLYLGWQSIIFRSEREWVRQRYEKDYFPELRKLTWETHAGRALITLFYSIYPLFLCVGVALLIKKTHVWLVVPFAWLGLSAFLVAVWWEMKWGERWSEYFARKYADRWGVDTKRAVRDDVPVRPI